MRKFLYEYETVWTEEQLREFYENESEDKEHMTYDEWLGECLGKNGALTEIRTTDTPRGQFAVSLYRVHYSDDPDDVAEQWLSPEQVKEQEFYYGLVCEEMEV